MWYGNSREAPLTRPAPVEELLADLARPEAYPEAVTAVRVVQTHTSCVFLTGARAWKVRKPVNFGFLDYSTPELRRHYAEEELRLNRRLCPSVYRGLAVVYRAAGGRLCLAEGETPPGGAAVVEWAVCMRELPAAEMLPARLEAGTVGPTEVDALARALARFHSGAERGPGVAAYGLPEAVARNVEENYSVCAPLAGEALPAEHLARITAWSRAFLAAQGALLRRRAASGWVREGHGDLRAQNLCLAPDIDGGVQPFDCIEFTPRFRCLDVADDLAYLCMDLDLASRADLRRLLVDRYLEFLPGTTGEAADFRTLLPFYCCYRACVRGKIALLAAAEPEIPAEERRAHAHLAATVFDLARGYAERRPRPVLLAVAGYSGSGKSMLARELARRLPAVLLSTDMLRKELAGVEPGTRLPPAAYHAEQRAAVYAAMRERAAEALAAGEHVVLDATFLQPEERERAGNLAARCAAEWWQVRCHCPDEVIRERLTRRAAEGGQVSDAGLAVYEMQRANTPLPSAPAPRVLDARGDTDPAAQARSLLSALWGHSPPAPPKTETA